MKKASYIKAEDLQNLQQDAEGNYIVPEGITIYIEESQEEKLQQRILEIENEMAALGEPTDKELIEMGRVQHPYYMLQAELESLKQV